MRNCPICDSSERTILWSSPFQVPDSWPLPKQIDWCQCDGCGLLYGDGDFDQDMLNEYYNKYYGYGVNSKEVTKRLQDIAKDIINGRANTTRVVDFGGSGDDGKSVIIEYLKKKGWNNVYCVNAGEDVPECDVLVASHVLEHVYDMPFVMNSINSALVKDGLLIVDGPDATGLLKLWNQPMLDFHTKHIIHFRLLDYLQLMDRYGFTLLRDIKYVDVRAGQSAPCLRLYFERLDTAKESRDVVTVNIEALLAKLRTIDIPVNVWGLGDISWHLLAQCKLQVLDYIDSDPAYRGRTYQGKLVLDRPSNDAPIVIMAQGQRDKLIEYIKKMGVTNELITI